MLRAGSGQPLPLFQKRNKRTTNKNQNAIMKNLIDNSERDPRKDAITKEDWVVYGIVAPIVFMLILGMGEVIGRLFG